MHIARDLLELPCPAPSNICLSMGSKVLVLNSGSSSLKFKLFDGAAAALTGIIEGQVERIGDVQNSALLVSRQGVQQKDTHKEPIPDHTTALRTVLEYLRSSGVSDIDRDVAAVGHRVVHGKHISRAVLVTDDIIRAIEDASDLAPLHNPANLQGIRAAQRAFPGKPSVAVFDTAFHQSMPPRAFLYALPYSLFQKRQLRRYGAHGTSVRYLVERAAKTLGKPEKAVNLIIAHIGAGASMTAVENGSTLDTTMGLTPLEGLVMSTRCGDVDPSVVLYLQRHCGLSVDQTDDLLNKKSGFLGLAGEADLRSVVEAAQSGSETAEIAIQVYVHRLRKYLGAYLVHLKGKVDAIVFSAGIGENSALIREGMVADLEAFGIEIDRGRNREVVGGRAGEIQAASSRTRLLVLPTGEELSIAEQTLEVVRSLN